MEVITRVRGDAGPNIHLTIYRDDVVVPLNGAGVSAAFRMRKRGSTSNVYSTACTGLSASADCYVPLTTTALATAGYYEGEVTVSGLSDGTQTTEIIPIVVRDSLAA